MTVIFLNY